MDTEQIEQAQDNKQRLILVTGATGYVGGRLAPRLLKAGYSVRCLVRDPERLAGRPWDGAEIVQGDILQPESLAAAMKGVDTAYYLVHSMAEGAHDFTERDHEAASNFGEAASKAGVKRIIYLGGLGAGNLSRHLKSRQEVGATLKKSGVPVTEFRAAVIVGSGSSSFEMVRYLTERIPVMITPSWVKTPCQPIGIRDLLAYLVAALAQPKSAGRIVEIGGADVVNYGKMFTIYAKVRELKRILVPVPVNSPLLSSLWVGLVTPIPASYARPLIEGLKNPVVVRDNSAKELFPDIQPMSYEAAVRLAVERTTLRQVETSWTSALSASPYLNPVGTRLESVEGLLLEKRTTEVDATPEDIFAVFSGIGGRRGWFYGNWLWRIRGIMDRAVGGVGLRRGRRDPNHLVPGDALDWWRVESVTPNRQLRLRAEMKMPGMGWLEFGVEPCPDGKVKVSQVAYFQPKGLFGLLYWYSLYPFHGFIFSGMLKSILERAERRHQRREEYAKREPGTASV